LTDDNVGGMPSVSGQHFAGSRRGTVSLVVLAAAAFVYVTAETLPVGLLPQLSAGLHVSDGAVGLLVTFYAAVAGLTAIPLTAWTNHLPRRRLVVGAVGLLAISQFGMAVAPDYGVVLAARVVCALAHGVFWSVLAPVAASLVAPNRAGRATAIVFTGNSLALLFGTPIATAMGEVLGWRASAALVGAAGALTVVGLRLVLPRLRSEAADAGARERLGSIPAVMRSRSLLAVCAVTALVATGHFTAYTYIVELVRHDAGLSGLVLSLVLLVYGVAGIIGTGTVGWITDQRPRLAILGCAGAVAAGLAILTTLGPGSVTYTITAIVVWGAAFTAIPVSLQSAVLRVAPAAADTASAVYVVAFQIGIGGGALVGSLLVDSGRLLDVPTVGMVLAAAATAVALAARQAFPSHPETPVRPSEREPVRS
jgi:predicted MFS family arabinose efflux permease